MGVDGQRGYGNFTLSFVLFGWGSPPPTSFSLIIYTLWGMFVSVFI